ncbi:MAG TPA: hypothetical protein VM182_13620 [Terriglobia bacterium]|nr:hypothetical protein [Terriglobia bacterium]
MSDRGIFVTSFLTVVLIVAGAFAIPEYYPFELIRSLVFVAIVVMVYFGENKYSYMLGVVAPIVLILLNILLGGFFDEFAVLWASVTMQPLPVLETPLHGLAILTEILLVVLCVRAWRKEVTESFFGKTFGICLAISLVDAAVLAAWYVWGLAERGRLP